MGVVPGEVHVFTDNRTASNAFRNWTRHSVGDLRKVRESIAPGSLVYLDLSNYKNWKRTARSFQDRYCAVGLLDLQNRISDVFGLVDYGIVDYLNKEALKSPIDRRRIGKVAGRIRFSRSIVVRKPHDFWTQITDGTRHPFLVVYLGLDTDHIASLRQKLKLPDVRVALRRLKEYIDEQIQPSGGRFWTWLRSSGLVFFPVIGDESDGIVACFRLMTARCFFEIEKSEIDTPIAITMAAHYDMFEWTDDRDPKKISSVLEINTVFKLGESCSPGLTVTESAQRFVPKELKPFLHEHEKIRGLSVAKFQTPNTFM